jgi:GR25 family glycosyltransferase involved in LPS biosynthesis
MTKVNAILKLGNFDSPNTFFEIDYARRWTNAGYKTGFFNQITCQHIGKLTKDKSTPNAYKLNQCDQFSSFVKVVNLERRPDRKARMQEELKGISHEFVKAVDGKELRPTEEMRRLFEKNDYGSRKSFMGCALSHCQLWKQLLQDTKEYYFIMEDDVTVCKDFACKLYSLDPVMKEKEICFLGYHMFSKDRDERYEREEDPNIQPLQSIFVGGTFAYSINKEGARKMIEYIEINGIQHGIDYVMKIAPVECVECIPHLVFSEWCEDGKQIDTDIQTNYESMEWDYVFMKGLDQHGNDEMRVSFDIKECNYPCVGINTLGFIKKALNVHQLKPSIYFGEKDGIYIKKEYYDLQKLIRVKMLCNWCSSEQLCKEWSNMCESNFIWQHIQMVWEGDCDYYVVINSTNKYHDPEKTIVFQMEPWVHDMSKPWGVKTWGTWAKPTGYLHVHDRDTYVNNVTWQLEQTYSQWLDMKIEKTKGLSTICSSKYFDEGHILRIDLLKQVDQQIEIDVYNQDNHHQFKQWKGPLSYVNKSKGMLPYRYYFMMENNFETNYITEKLWEPILCESLCFYYGCPNVEDHIDPRAYVLLDKDIDTSIALIQQAIKEDWYTQRLPYIRTAKMDLLHRMSFFPTLNTIIQSKKRSNPFTEQYKRVCFIHSCHIKEVGTSILEHMVEMVLSQEFDKIFVVNIGEPVNIVHPKIQVIEYSKNIYSFELETINLIRTFSENQECDVLYLHTKGITQKSPNVTDWVNMMLYFLVEKTEECVEKLKEYDTVGCNLYLHSHECRSHYSGNFWWAKTSYLRTLPYLSMISSHEAEIWLLMNHKCKWYSMHNSHIDHYQSSYPKINYELI